MKFGLTDTELKSIINTFREFDEIEEVLLFGSRAMSTYKPTSDIDLAIKGVKLTLNTITSLNAQLEELSVVYMFDVVNYNKVDNPKFIKHIDRYGIRIYSQTKGQANYFLKNVTTKIGSGATPKDGQKAYHDEGISLIRSQNVLDFDFSYNGLAFIDDDQAAKLKNVTVEENDILLNITGDSVARVCKIPTEVLPARVNQHVAIIRPNPEKLDNDYLLYYLLNPPFKKYMLKIASDGATCNAITKVDIEDFEIIAPEDVDDQKEIATILSTLDQKTTLLKKQNQTLEELAQTLFKRWFVENIDESWEESSLSDIADIRMGRTPPRKEDEWFTTNTEDVKWISIKDMGECGVYVSDTSEYLTKKAVEKFNIPLIPKNTVVLSFKMTLGRIAITTEEMLSNEAIAHFKIKDENIITPEFLYFFLKTYRYQKLGSTSSIVTSINSGMIKDIDLRIPDKKSMIRFESASKAMFNTIKNNSKEIQSLTQLRDTLLPKLMSGNLEIKS